MALEVVEFPEDIAWLDLSFNGITSISDSSLSGIENALSAWQ